MVRLLKISLYLLHTYANLKQMDHFFRLFSLTAYYSKNCRYYMLKNKCIGRFIHVLFET